jgi:hypothetical protein
MTAFTLVVVVLAAPLLRARRDQAEFDTSHTVKLQGVVTNVEWTNPHAILYADVKDDHGKVANWRLELGSRDMLARYDSWTSDTVKPGDRIIVQGFEAQGDSDYLSVGRIWLPNGQSLQGRP